MAPRKTILSPQEPLGQACFWTKYLPSHHVLEYVAYETMLTTHFLTNQEVQGMSRAPCAGSWPVPAHELWELANSSFFSSREWHLQPLQKEWERSSTTNPTPIFVEQEEVPQPFPCHGAGFLPPDNDPSLCPLSPSGSPLQLCRKHKVGILYCKAGQSSEEEMYNNEEAGPAFEEFLSLIGDKVCLKGFTKYAAQLDVKSKCQQLQGI